MATTKESDNALIMLLEPDGYYRYLGVVKPLDDASFRPDVAAASGSASNAATPNGTASIDEESIKKNYRKLSLRHHPDKGGDPDTFRMLNRAYRVLMNPNLRQQYDILGIDLDDEDEGTSHQDGDNKTDADEGKETSSTQRIVQEIGSTVLHFVLSLGFRTRKLPHQAYMTRGVQFCELLNQFLYSSDNGIGISHHCAIPHNAVPCTSVLGVYLLSIISECI
jgi:DnaJ domain